jgi:hypothetical protein
VTDSIFNTASDQTGGDPPAIDPNKNYVEELVGEGKKFKTVEDLARSIIHKDHFIDRLKGETEGLRTELNTRLTLEQYLDKMGMQNNQNQNSNNGRSDDPLNEPKGDRTDTSSSLKPEDIERLIETKVTEREQQRIQSQNKADVQRKLVEAFGENYVPKLKETADALGLTPEVVDRMAAETPKALLRLLGADNPQQSTATQQGNSLFVPPQNQQSVRSNSGPSGDKTKAFYDALKQKDPKGYWSPAVQNQMHKDAMRLGERFFDT